MPGPVSGGGGGSGSDSGSGSGSGSEGVGVSDVRERKRHTHIVYTHSIHSTHTVYITHIPANAIRHRAGMNRPICSLSLHAKSSEPKENMQVKTADAQRGPSASTAVSARRGEREENDTAAKNITCMYLGDKPGPPSVSAPARNIGNRAV